MITLHRMNPCPATAMQIEQAKSRQKSSCKPTFYTIKTIPSGQNQSYKQKEEQDFSNREYLNLPNDKTVKLFRFVITASGELICGSNEPEENVSHGAMVNDAPVFAAGELGMNEENELLYISNRTGHYRIPPSTLALVYSYLIDIEGYSADQIKEIYEGKYTVANNDSLDYSIEKIGDHFVHQPSAFKNYPIQSSSRHSTGDNNENTSTHSTLNNHFTLFSIFDMPASPNRYHDFLDHP